MFYVGIPESGFLFAVIFAGVLKYYWTIDYEQNHDQSTIDSYSKSSI